MGDGAQPLQGKLFYPAGFCREIIAEFINNGEPDGYSVELDVDEDMERVVVWGDQHLLRRAIGNLLHNSIRHNPGGCDVRLRLCGKDRMVLFVVSDNGKGMTLGEIDLLQTRSHYLSDAASDFDGRHGLGLYIVQQIVKMHSGHTAFAKSESGGLKVTIELPMA